MALENLPGLTDIRGALWNSLCVELRAEVDLVVSTWVDQRLDGWRDGLLAPVQNKPARIILNDEKVAGVIVDQGFARSTPT